MIWMFLSLALLLVGIRTALWHVRAWQLREYRIDRMRAWLRTDDGTVFWRPWLKPGLLPRPKASGRVLMILAILGFIALIWILITYTLPFATYCWALSALLWERTLFAQVAIAVWISAIPTNWKKQKLFRTAAKIIEPNADIIRIGITGSYGKSSTKEILVHLLESHFGKENVLYNPANQNNEVAIARLIIDKQSFLSPHPGSDPGPPRILVIETGAYKRGEIATVCKFLKPHIGLLTGLNQQHIELFGSQQAIGEAKFELPAAVSQKVFFNADNDLLVQLFEDKNTTATKIPISTSSAQDLKTEIDRSTFTAYGDNFVLPWPGGFFVQNALLALECAREIGVPIKTLNKSLSTLKPLERALSLETHSQGFSILKDTYSANLDGVLQAIAHMKNFSGQRLFVGLPLRELGDEAKNAHEKIFTALKDIKAQVFWCRTDFADVGKKVLGDQFQVIEKDFSSLEKTINQLGKADVILLESKIPNAVSKLL